MILNQETSLLVRWLTPCILAILGVFPSLNTLGSQPTKKLPSPDGILIATILPSHGINKDESRIEIRSKDGKVIQGHDFSSPDGQHGYGADSEMWAADSQFLAVRLSSSGGHSPMFDPVVIWRRKDSTFYELPRYTASQIFRLSGRDRLTVSTWPDLRPATISLDDLKPDQVSKLAP